MQNNEDNFCFVAYSVHCGMDVVLRVRPHSENESKRSKQGGYFTVQDVHTLLVMPSRNISARNLAKMESSFHFTRIFSESVSQEEFYDATTKRVVQDVLLGKSGLLFTYGVTNSGKTYTIQGTPQEPGILIQALRDLFDLVPMSGRSNATFRPHGSNEMRRMTPKEMEQMRLLKKKLFHFACSKLLTGVPEGCSKLLPDLTRPSTRKQWKDALSPSHAASPRSRAVEEYNIWVSFIEIYKDQVLDLLKLPSENCEATSLKVAEGRNRMFFVKGVREIQVQSAEEALMLFSTGKRNLHVKSTMLNRNSSRGLTFCDLAGSERLAKHDEGEDRMFESVKINSSLLVLSRCISALYWNQKHRYRQQLVPYRDSRLTRVLQQSLACCENMCMIVNINQNASSFRDTFYVLRFAAVVQMIKKVPKRSGTIVKVARNESKLTESNLRKHRTSDKLLKRYNGDEGIDVFGKLSSIVTEEPVSNDYPIHSTPNATISAIPSTGDHGSPEMPCESEFPPAEAVEHDSNCNIANEETLAHSSPWVGKSILPPRKVSYRDAETMTSPIVEQAVFSAPEKAHSADVGTWTDDSYFDPDLLSLTLKENTRLKYIQETLARECVILRRSLERAQKELHELKAEQRFAYSPADHSVSNSSSSASANLDVDKATDMSAVESPSCSVVTSKAASPLPAIGAHYSVTSCDYADTKRARVDDRDSVAEQLYGEELSCLSHQESDIFTSELIAESDERTIPAIELSPCSSDNHSVSSAANSFSAMEGESSGEQGTSKDESTMAENLSQNSTIRGVPVYCPLVRLKKSRTAGYEKPVQSNVTTSSESTEISVRKSKRSGVLIKSLSTAVCREGRHKLSPSSKEHTEGPRLLRDADLTSATGLQTPPEEKHERSRYSKKDALGIITLPKAISSSPYNDCETCFPGRPLRKECFQLFKLASRQEIVAR
ncbi:kinesin motor domain protein [Trichuris suis]|nr:kinesin motor domain protein [Trichuris suis]